MSTIDLNLEDAELAGTDPLNGMDFDIPPEPVAPPVSRPNTDPPTNRRPSRAKGSAERNLVRRAAQKALAVDAAPADHRRLLAGLLGCPDDPVALATEVLCTSRAVGVVADLQEVSAADPMEAGVLVASWERPRSTALWNLLVDFGALQGTRPPHDAKAALALARAALGLSDDDRTRVDAIAALARRS